MYLRGSPGLTKKWVFTSPSIMQLHGNIITLIGISSITNIVNKSTTIYLLVSVSNAPISSGKGPLASAEVTFRPPPRLSDDPSARELSERESCLFDHSACSFLLGLLYYLSTSYLCHSTNQTHPRIFSSRNETSIQAICMKTLSVKAAIGDSDVATHDTNRFTGMFFIESV